MNDHERQERDGYGDGDIWGDVGRRWQQQKHGQASQNLRGDETQWGQAKTVTVKRTGVEFIVNNSQQMQIVLANRNAKVWSAQLSVTVMNPDQSPSPPIPIGDRFVTGFKILCGTGQVTIPSYQSLDSGLGGANLVSFPGDQPNMSAIVQGLPAATIVIGFTLFYLSAAAAGDLLVQVAAAVAPMNREND